QTNARTLISEVRYLPGVEIRTHSGTGEVLHVISASAGSNSVQVLHWVARQPDDIAQDQVRYSLGDHLKSSTLELDQQARLISQEWYYPFGDTAYWAGRNTTEAKYKTVRYSGKERDATGLDYYGFRYYAPWLRRWINPDPAGYVDGMNLFSMVKNSPMTYLDKQGDIRSDFNPEQYLAEFKAIITEHRPSARYSNHFKQTNHYITKIYKIENISTKKERKYFKSQIRKFNNTLLPQTLSSLTNELEIRSFQHLKANIKAAKKFIPLKPYLPAYSEVPEFPPDAYLSIYSKVSNLRPSSYPPAYLEVDRIRLANHSNIYSNVEPLSSNAYSTTDSGIESSRREDFSPSYTEVDPLRPIGYWSAYLNVPRFRPRGNPPAYSEVDRLRSSDEQPCYYNSPSERSWSIDNTLHSMNPADDQPITSLTAEPNQLARINHIRGAMHESMGARDV
ncbi:RHS repeat-associated core domain-containing protein, partial [Pseudomonas fluorescens]|uniref:RHS repeat-associated core domain-containing protein n=1 Tax=Pseudomonas fluorescens TaxID=294 RepID=UPI003CFCCDB6